MNFSGGTLSSTSGSLTDNGALVATPAAATALAISNSITGTGGVALSGSGTLTLSGANTYTGATTVSGGSLTGGAAYTFSASSVTTVSTGGTLDLGGYAQTITTLDLAGGTVKNGSLTGAITSTGGTIVGLGGGLSLTVNSGTTLLKGTNTYTGSTTVFGGTLEVGDSTDTTASLAGDVMVQSGGTLAGHGTVDGDVDNSFGGTVSPGGSIGILTIGGAYTQGATSTLAIEVSPTAASKLVVGGTATLNGTLSLTYDPGVYTARSYTIVQASSLSGTFSTISGTLSGFDSSVDYSSSTATLSLDKAAVVAPSWTGALANTDQLVQMKAQSANGLLFSHLDGTSGPDSGWSAAPTSRQLAFAGDDQQLAAVLSGLPQTVLSMGGWVRVVGDISSVNGSASATGYNTGGGGLLAGIDREVADNVKAGIAAGYSRARLFSHDGGTSTLDSPRVMLYGTYSPAPDWSVDAALGYAFDTIATRRNTATGTASARHNANEATAETQVRTKIDAGPVRLVPAVGVSYVVADEFGYNETGASGNDLAVASRTAQSLQPFVRLTASHDYEDSDGTVWSPNATLGYARELIPATSAIVSVGGGTFTATALAASRDQMSVGVGISARLDNSLSVDAGYQLTPPTGNLIQQTLSADLRWRF